MHPPVDDPPLLSALGEDGLIRRIRRAAQTADPAIIRGIGDDAAVVAAGDKTVITTDLLIEAVHFLLSTTPARLLGRKALSVNLSDLAAMGSVPRFAFLGLGAAGDFSSVVMDEIMGGFIERAGEAGVTLTGGDVCRSASLVLAVTVVGEARLPGPVYRSGACAGNAIFVTGTVGDSGLGLRRLSALDLPVTMEAIESDPLREPILRQLDPPARIEAGLRLAGIATAMMDLSDGIMIDLPRLLIESGGLGAVVDVSRLPLSAPFREYFQAGAEPAGEALRLALSGGEDYELLFTAPPGREALLAAIGRELGTPVSRIGEVRESAGLILQNGSGREIELPEPVFEHFPGKRPGD